MAPLWCKFLAPFFKILLQKNPSAKQNNMNPSEHEFEGEDGEKPSASKSFFEEADDVLKMIAQFPISCDTSAAPAVAAAAEINKIVRFLKSKIY